MLISITRWIGSLFPCHIDSHEGEVTSPLIHNMVSAYGPNFAVKGNDWHAPNETRIMVVKANSEYEYKAIWHIYDEPLMRFRVNERHIDDSDIDYLVPVIELPAPTFEDMVFQELREIKGMLKNMENGES